MRHQLEISVFISGAILMIFEIAGARLVAPYLGSSTYIWTSIIGVIMASLSLGYWYGGKIADEKANWHTLAGLFVLSALCIVISFLLKDLVLGFLSRTITDLRLASFLASLALFAPASFFIAMISPYAVKLKIRDLASSGQTVGSLYAISTVGSIVGTFSVGFFLIPHLGINTIILLCAAIMLLTSLLVLPKKWWLRTSALTVLLALYFGDHYLAEINPIKHINTQHSHFTIKPTTYNGRPTLMLMTDPMTIQSGIYLDTDDPQDLVFDSVKYYRLSQHFHPDIQHALVIGGAAYSFPRSFLKTNLQAKMDVVEIDPGVTQIAREHFQLKPDLRLNIIHQDGRIYLNHSQAKYDFILLDAFNSNFSIPFHLTTQEATEKIYARLNNAGVVVVNLISHFDPQEAHFLYAIHQAYQHTFPQVHVFATPDPQDPQRLQNIILVALKSAEPAKLTSTYPIFSTMLRNRITLDAQTGIAAFTDDYAPVEYYIDKMY